MDAAAGPQCECAVGLDVVDAEAVVDDDLRKPVDEDGGCCCCAECGGGEPQQRQRRAASDPGPQRRGVPRCGTSLRRSLSTLIEARSKQWPWAALCSWGDASSTGSRRRAMTKEKDVDAGPLGPGPGREGRDLVAGYLDVKLPARNRRKRFGSWKSWRRHWVEARLATDDDAATSTRTLELYLSPARLGPYTEVIRVAVARASVCRTASRSRAHAFVVATPASAASSASLASSCTELSGDVFLAARSDQDTERWMAALRCAVAVAAPPAPRVATVNPRGLSLAANAALLGGRRLSRSEGDLLASALDLDQDLLHAGPPAATAGEALRGRTAATDVSSSGTLGRSPLRQRPPFRLLYGRRRAETLRADDPPCPDRLSTSPQATSRSGSALSLLGGKIASGLISAGLGLILSTPGGSEVEDNDMDVDESDASAAMPSPASQHLQQVGEALTALVLDRRRQSFASEASGIYEEIRDPTETILKTAPGTPIVVIDRVYENAAAAVGRRASDGCESLYEDPAMLFSPWDDDDVTDGSALAQSPPPPLPPRQNLTPMSELLTRTNGRVEPSLSHCALDASGYVQMGLVRSIHAKCYQDAPGSSELEPTYLPMSPIRPFLLDACDKNV